MYVVAPSGQMTAVDKLVMALKQEVSELKEEVKILKQEKDDTMETTEKDVHIRLTKRLTEMNKDQAETKEEMKNLKRMLTEKTLDINT